MSSPSAIRIALAAQISANVTGLRTLTDPGSIANPPVAVVLPVTGAYIDYTIAQQGFNVYDVNLRVLILLARASEREALPLFDGYLAPYGATSVPAAIQKDPTLGGATDFCVPVQATGPAPVTWAGIDYWGAEIVCKAGAE